MAIGLVHCVQDVVDYTGRVPKYLFEWLNWSATWQSFSFEYLKTWGGRFSPSLESGDWWLWFTSFYLHQNLQHIVSNMLLFVAMSVHLELNYGWWRLLLVWVISGAQRCTASASAVRGGHGNRHTRPRDGETLATLTCAPIGPLPPSRRRRRQLRERDV